MSVRYKPTNGHKLRRDLELMFDFAGTGTLWAENASGNTALESGQYCKAIDRPTVQVINALPGTHV